MCANFVVTCIINLHLCHLNKVGSTVKLYLNHDKFYTLSFLRDTTLIKGFFVNFMTPRNNEVLYFMLLLKNLFYYFYYIVVVTMSVFQR